MRNFLLSVLSFIICVALLAGGLYLTYTTSDIEAIKNDFVELMDNEKYPWIVGVDKGAEETPEDNSQKTE